MPPKRIEKKSTIGLDKLKKVYYNAAVVEKSELPERPEEEAEDRPMESDIWPYIITYVSIFQLSDVIFFSAKTG